MRWLPIALLGVLVGAGLVLLLQSADGESGTFPVQIVGPDQVIFDGNVSATDASALDVLLAAGRAGGFEVDVTGTGSQAFVRAIDAIKNDGRGGWCYSVWVDEWVYPVMSAGAFGLENGQPSRWVYRVDGCPAG